MTRNDSTSSRDVSASNRDPHASSRTVPVSRRRVLRATGGALVGLGATDLAGAAPDPPTDTGGPVEVNVGFAAPSGRTAALSAAGEVVRKFDSLDAATVRLPRTAAERLRSRRDVRYVEANGRMRALATDAAPTAVTWGYERVDADAAYANGYTGDGADVAIVDTGIDANHPCLNDDIGPGGYAVECNSWSAECTHPWGDDNGHGTALALVVGSDHGCGCRAGVAPDATLHSVKVLGSDGSGSFSDIAAGIEYVADQGWDVANVSLGGSASSAVRDAVQYAAYRGVVIVAAAGNGGSCTDCVSYPAAYPETIAVSATDQNDRLAHFSSTGPEIDVAAPGAEIWTEGSLGGDCEPLSGTSMAAPFVSAAAGILMANGYDAASTRSRLLSTAEDVGLRENEQGDGLLDVAAATP